MPRPLWTGSLNFGLVNVPVRLVSAVRDLDLHFRQLHAKDHTPVETRRVCSKEDKEVAYEEIGNAYDLDGEQVVLTDEELSAADPTKTRTIDIEAFVEARRDRPDLLRPPVLPRPRGRDRRHGPRLPAAGRGDGQDRPRRARALRPAHEGVPRRDPRAREGADALDACASTTRSARPTASPAPAGARSKAEVEQRRRADRGAVGPVGPGRTTRTSTASGCRRSCARSARAARSRRPRPTRRRAAPVPDLMAALGGDARPGSRRAARQVPALRG